MVRHVTYFRFAGATVNAADLPFGVIPDTIDYSWTAQGVTVDLTANTATGLEIGNQTLLGTIVNVIGGSGNDTISGGVEANHLVGNGGDDILGGGAGDDILDGGTGFDTARYGLAASAVIVDLAAGTATSGGGNDTLISIERVVGSDHNDTLRGDAGNNTLEGGAGDDLLEGRDGDDVLGGGFGNDILDGGAGFDTASYGLALGAVNADLVAGTALVGGVDTDTLISIEALVGSAFNDRLSGNAADNTLVGNDGNDFLVGLGGNDTLIGGNGIDIARFSGVRSQYTITPGGVPGSSTVTDNVVGRDGTDTLTGVELTEYSNAYVLNARILDLSSFGGLAAGKQIFGTNLNNAGVGDGLTLGLNANGRFIDLGAGGTDTLTLATANTTYNLNLANVEILKASFGAETINMSSVVSNNMLVDMSFGLDTLNLANGNNTVTVTNVENVNAFGGANTVTFLHNDFTVGQSFNLGSSADGLDTLVLDGSDSNYSLTTLGGDMLVVGASDSGDETVSVFNTVLGATFDLGAGDDSLGLNSNSVIGLGVNVVSVQNVENVTAIGDKSDQIHILGNSDAPTTVTAGGGADIVWASADVDYFRFTGTGDSPDIGGQRDVVIGFDAAEDRFVFDGIPGTSFAWQLVNVVDDDGLVRVDFDGNASGDIGWDMAIHVNDFTGTLTIANFEWLP